MKESHLAVLLHGFGGSSEMINMIASALAENGVTSITYDIPGHGKSVGSLYKKIFKIPIGESIKEYFKTDNLAKRCIISLSIFALTYLTYILMFKNFLNIQLTFNRYPYFISSIFIILPYTFFNELFFRVLVSGLMSKKLLKILIPIILRITGLLTFYSSIMLIATSLGYSGGMIGYLLIVVYMFAILQIGLDIISSTIFTKTGSIIEQVISTAIMYSAILTSISPMM